MTAGLLAGDWRLVSASAVGREGNSTRPPYGPQPMGRLVLSPDGRMIAVLCDGRVSLPEGETRAYSSYCGNYGIENGCLITRVDAAAVKSRVGGDEIRRLEIRGEKLVLIPPRRADGEQRELIWERCGPG